MRCRPSWSLSTLGSKHACDKNRRSSVTYASIISVFPPHPIPSSRTTKYTVCCCCLHIKESRSDLYSVPSVTAGKCNWRHSGWSARLVGFPQCYLTCRFLTNKIFYLIQVWVVFRMKKREAENYQLICVNVSTSEDARLTVYRSGDSTGV